MSKLFIYLSILLSVVITACENEIPFQQGTRSPQLLMNAVLGAGKANNEVQLKIIENNESRHVASGSVTVYVNGKKTETAEAIVYAVGYGDTTKLCLLGTPFQPGDLVRLEADAEDGKFHASAEVRIPRPVEESIQVDTFLTQLKVGFNVEKCMRYKITLHDRPGENNYYQLILLKNEYWGDPDAGWEYDPYITYEEIINQEDIVLTDGHLTTADDEEFGNLDMNIRNKTNVFTDNRFKNTSYTLKVYTRFFDYHNYGEESHIVIKTTIRLLSVTEAYYRYMRVLNCLESDNYNPTFMEPVILPCNVQGGLGFVGATSEQQLTIRIFDRPPLWVRPD